MFLILIVEDDKKTRELLRELLSDTFPNSKIDVAGTVSEGHECIRATSDRNLRYDVAILDFKLPQKEGESSEFDASLYHDIREKMSGAFVIYITAYPDDLLVWKHLYEFHRDRRDAQGDLVPKKGSDWPIKLLKKMKAYLYGTRIEAQMDELFGSEEQSVSRLRAPTMSNRCRGGRSLTHALAALSRDIIAHWDDLDERLKKRIQSIFNVDTESVPIRISLL